jgi:DNA (cytosine-5)-methyltransferase 1
MKYLTNKKPPLTAISLFSGAMGLDTGFEQSGFQIKVTCEMRKEACDTIRLNRPDVPLLEGDIAEYTTGTILETAGLQIGEPTVVIGGPPCQSFSTAGTRKSFNEKRGIALLEFVRVVKESRPRFFVFENVKGLTNASLKHISFYERIKMKENEIPDESKLGTAFKYVLGKLAETGYSISYKILNSADYGSPQKRLRLIIIGARDGEDVGFPDQTHDSPNSIQVITGKRRPWRAVGDVLKDLREDEQEYVKFPSWGKYIRYIKPGGDWRDLPPEIQREAMKGSFFSQGGRTGYFRRLSLDLPCPTLVTSPVFKGTCLAHPIFDRPLSIQEYARIQGFPDYWKFVGSTMKKYRMIGEAVPVELSYALGCHIRDKVNSLINIEYSIRRGRS